jgi:outer membrane biosynthesis protein TonB
MCKRRLPGIAPDAAQGSGHAVLCPECRTIKNDKDAQVRSSRRFMNSQGTSGLNMRIAISSLIIFTCLVVCVALASFRRSSKGAEIAAAPSKPAAPKVQLPAQPAARAEAKNENQKAPAVADTKNPEPAAAVKPSAPDSHLPRPEQNKPEASPKPPMPTDRTVAESKTPIPANAETRVPLAAPPLADDVEGPVPAQSSNKEFVWIEDALPAGAHGIKETNNEEWLWVKQDPAPFSGAMAHQATIQNGPHQHAFLDANPGLKIERGEILTAYVYIDPAHVPSEIMLQWHAGDGYFSHRAYWGANKLEWGSDGSPSRRNIGALPPPGQWTLLQIPASQVGLEGLTVTGMSFTIVNGRVTWDRIGKLSPNATAQTPPTATVRPAVAMTPPPAPASVEAKAPQKAPAPAAPPTDLNAKDSYEKILTAAYAKLSSKAVDGAIDDLEKAQVDAQYADLRETVSSDLACARAYKEYLAAAASGVAQLSSRRPFTLKTIDGKETVLKGHTSLKEFKDGALWIEEEMGGATATRKLPFEQLAPQTIFDLATLSLTPGPATDLKLGFGGFVTLLNNGTVSIPELRSRLESARKDLICEPAAERALARLENLVDSRATNAGMKRIEAAIKGKDYALARSLLKDFKRDFGPGAPQSVRDFIEKATFETSELEPGLWASYFCGDEPNPARKYLFSRAETKLNFNWGRGSPDPRVPHEFFTIRFNGLLRVRVPATYTFMATADDMLELSIDGKRLLSVSWNSDNTTGKNCAIRLEPGDHEIRVVFKQLLVDSFLNVKWKLDNESKWQEIPESMLWHDPRLVEKYQKEAF